MSDWLIDRCPGSNQTLIENWAAPNSETPADFLLVWCGAMHSGCCRFLVALGYRFLHHMNTQCSIFWLNPQYRMSINLWLKEVPNQKGFNTPSCRLEVNPAQSCTLTGWTFLTLRTRTLEFNTWGAHPTNESAQAGVETDVVGVFVGGGQQYQPMPALLPSLWFGIPTPGSILVGARIFSCCGHPRPGNVPKLTVRTVTLGDYTKWIRDQNFAEVEQLNK